MMMIWGFQRRPTRFMQVFRSALAISAAVAVPVGVEVLRRFIRNGKVKLPSRIEGSVRIRPSTRRRRRTVA